MSARPWTELTEAERAPWLEAATAAMDDLHCCTRVWSAWSCGTMSSDDFPLAVEDDALVEERAAAIYERLHAHKFDDSPLSQANDLLRRQLAAAHRILDVTEEEDTAKLDVLTELTLQLGGAVKPMPGEGLVALCQRVVAELTALRGGEP